MPNHSTNRLLLRGDPDKLDEFLDRQSRTYRRKVSGRVVDIDRIPTSEHFTFEAIIPTADNVATGNTGDDGFWWDAETARWKGARTNPPPEGVEVEYFSFVTMADGTVYSKKEAQELGIQSWYDWNVKNWGTKWDAYDVHVNRTRPDLVEINFQTAWGPPNPIIERLALMFDVEFRYIIEGGLGVGGCSAKKGTALQWYTTEEPEFLGDWDDEEAVYAFRDYVMDEALRVPDSF